MLRYPDVVKAYPLIVKSVPGGVDTAGAMTSEEFDDAMCALKVKRLDSQGVAEAFSYLTTETITQAAWKKLEPFIKKIQLNAQDFIAFMRSIVRVAQGTRRWRMAVEARGPGLVPKLCAPSQSAGTGALGVARPAATGSSRGWMHYKPPYLDPSSPLRVEPLEPGSTRPWKVLRSQNGELPVYSRYRYAGKEVTTIVTHIFGDIEAIRKELMSVCESPCRERPGKLEVRGYHKWKIKEWLLSLGM
ncbi:unnamed protein product [Durusdinium trenchii]|uniref:Large ribosomal subunit protein mL49 n=1 Tax=Durusdinium trenchii TaxID=1381693 RepID=A0ABP0N375_9DINO